MWELATTSDGSIAFHRYAVLPRVCRQGRSVPRSCAERGPTPNGKEAPGTGDTLGGRSSTGKIAAHGAPPTYNEARGVAARGAAPIGLVPCRGLLGLGWVPKPRSKDAPATGERPHFVARASLLRLRRSVQAGIGHRGHAHGTGIPGQRQSKRFLFSAKVARTTEKQLAAPFQEPIVP